jgi:hypothetical protein
VNSELQKTMPVVGGAAHSPELRPWVRPTFESMSLKEALTGSGAVGDNGGGSS